MLTALLKSRNSAARIQGLVLSNIGANKTHGRGDIEGLIDRIQHHWGEEFWNAFVARGFHNLPASPLFEQVRDYPARLRQRLIIEALRGQHAMDFAPILHTLPRVRVVIVYGKHDPARTQAHAQEMANGINGATQHVLDTGHTSCAEDPETFAAILRATAYE